MFTSVVYGQSKDSLQVVSNDINDSEEVFEIGMDEEIDNFDFLYTNNGEIFNYDEVLVDNLMQEAYKHIGARYRYGSKGPNAFDCSGFTSFVYKKSNMNIGASSREQYARNIPIKREDLQPGEVGIALGTASPAKLYPLMERITKEPILLPKQLEQFLNAEPQITKMKNGYTTFKRLLLSSNGISIPVRPDFGEK